jgi:type IV pilus assembly protein PilW
MNALARDERGYTLAEMLVVSATVAIVMAGLFSLLTTGSQSYTIGANRTEAQQNARLTLQRMIQELRTAGYDPSSSGAFAAVTALGAGTGFVIRNDWNGNGAIDTGVTVTVDGVAHGEQITYTFNGTTLTRQESNIDNAAVTVTDAVSSVAIRYLDADDVAVATPSGANATLIRTVEIDITANPDTTVSSNVFKASSAVTNRVRIRNR